MRPRLSLRIALLTIAVFYIAFGMLAYINRSPVIIKLFGGRRNTATVAQPTRIEAYRLGDLPASIEEEKARPFDFPVTSGPVAVPQSIAAELVETLLAPNSYRFNLGKACGWPVYGVRFTFHQGADSIDVYCCYRCRDLAICQDGKVLGGADFDNASPLLVRAAKACFSSDPEIQALTDH